MGAQLDVAVLKRIMTDVFVEYRAKYLSGVFRARESACVWGRKMCSSRVCFGWWCW